MNKRGIDVYSDLVKNRRIYTNLPPKAIFSFDGGAKVDFVTRNPKQKAIATFKDTDNDSILYSTELSGGTFAIALRKWISGVEILVTDEKGEFLDMITFPQCLEGKKIFVHFDSSSLGDTLAWIPAVDDFQRIWNCDLYVTTFWNSLFDGAYDNIRFYPPGYYENGTFASIGIGWYEESDILYHRRDPRTIPLQEIAYDHLGITREFEKIPNINGILNPHTQDKKYVCISTTGTAAAKYWNRQGGWQQVVNYLDSIGYEVKVIQKEPTDLIGVTDVTGDIDILERARVISGCEFFIGIGSGISWLAWACKKPVIMISGFSDPLCEFTTNNYRVINRNVCNSCFNKTEHKFDRKNWTWCPVHSDTDRQFECTREITFEMVRDSIVDLINTNR